MNSLHSGIIGTPMAVQGLGASDPAVRRQMAEMSPFKREGTSDEVTAAAVFLISDESSFVGGSALVVDGGWSAR